MKGKSLKPNMNRKKERTERILQNRRYKEFNIKDNNITRREREAIQEVGKEILLNKEITLVIVRQLFFLYFLNFVCLSLSIFECMLRCMHVMYVCRNV